MNKNTLLRIIETKIVIAAVLLMAFYLTWQNDIQPVAAVLQIIIAFTLPGWLLVDLLFPIDKIEIEVRIIIGLILSALVSAVTYFVADQFSLNGDPIHILSGLILFLAVVDTLRWRTPPKERVSGRVGLWIFALSVLILFGSVLFSLMHRAEIPQGYTQFYYLEEDHGEEDGTVTWKVIVANLEEEEKAYRLACADNAGNQIDFHAVLLAPGEEKAISVRYQAQTSDEVIKSRILLYIDRETRTPYRWIELPVEGCAFIFTP